jgi:hypothetical protein
MPSKRFISLIAVCISLIASASAAAAPTWLAPHPVSAAGTDNDKAQVAFGANGDSAAIWLQGTTVWASLRPAGGSFGSPQMLGTGTDPAVGVDGQGRAVAIWTVKSAKPQVFYATAPSGGSFGGATPLSDAADSVITTPNYRQTALAVSPNGEAVAAWSVVGDLEPNRVRVAVAPPGGAFGGPQSFDDAYTYNSDADNVHLGPAPAVGVNRDGTAVLAFVKDVGAVPTLYASARAPGGGFGPAGSVSTAGEHVVFGRVDVNEGGAALLTWAALVPGSTPGEFTDFLEASVRPAGGSFSAVKKVSGSVDQINSWGGVIEPDGTARVVWSQQVGASDPLTTGYKLAPPGGDFPSGDAKPLSAAGAIASSANLARDPSGEAVAVWREKPSGQPTMVRAARADGGADFGASQPISAIGDDTFAPVTIALDDQGNGIAAWLHNTGSDVTPKNAVEVAGYDAAGPQLRSLSVPGSGGIGAPLGFSVSPLDVWSAVGSTAWTFGDGASAPGTTASHAYSRGGRFTVGITSTDSLGNNSSGSAAVNVGSGGVLGSTAGSAPVLSRVKLSRTRFRAARSGASIATPVGTNVTYKLDTASTVTFRVEACTKLRRGKCVRYKRMRGSFRKKSGAGTITVHFTGRLNHKALKPGFYKLDLQALSAAKVKGKTIKLGFRIVKQ